MALSLNGRWEVQQLIPYLQDFVENCTENFNGTHVSDSMELNGAVTEINYVNGNE